uniref:Zinc finger protein n=1 Tax=Ciona intestinalis TaxID=7719 RepID=Q1RQ12_CIOIN|nr:zinc finger protein [Ciona intestinalis]BAE93273.1 zinc finger protein [Ciona intestinalis]|eukprot:NP_001071895.1 zinc finger protein [Ciona intestinalis]
MESSSDGHKLAKTASGLRMIPVSDMYASPFALSEPQWVSDKDCNACESCKKSFDFFNRRHHCRRCGLCFCDNCTHYVLPLKRMYFMDPVRHCYDCAVISKAETEFYEKSIPALTQGTLMSVSEPIANSSESFGEFDCKLSKDHRILKLVHTKKSKADANPPKIILSKLLEIKFIITDSGDAGTQKTPAGFKITYKDEEDSAITHSLILRAVEPKSSLPWLSSFQKAIKMLFEARNVA